MNIYAWDRLRKAIMKDKKESENNVHSTNPVYDKKYWMGAMATSIYILEEMERIEREKL